MLWRKTALWHFTFSAEQFQVISKMKRNSPLQESVPKDGMPSYHPGFYTNICMYTVYSSQLRPITIKTNAAMDRDHTNLNKVLQFPNVRIDGIFIYLILFKLYLSTWISVLNVPIGSEHWGHCDIRNGIPAEPALWWEPTPEPGCLSALCPAAAG